ncbi:MAG: hypothetical protein A3D92_21390 [Bacteroidetes bacterium RIFCSPHIGHO2_02_FULL_44_7]|nr:MAG: hypothetical protein A3D92_21390 [Bacteroidetes bacterium RIFCSPHIGHO2_02_FULL_44_7]
MVAGEEAPIHRPFATERYFLAPEKARERFQYAAIEEVYVSEFVGDPLLTETNGNDESFKQRALQHVVEELLAPMLLGSLGQLNEKE